MANPVTLKDGTVISSNSDLKRWMEKQKSTGPGIMGTFNVPAGTLSNKQRDLANKPFFRQHIATVNQTSGGGGGGGEHGGGGEGSGNMGAWGDYLSWQRSNLKDLLRRYREEFPKFLKGWKDDSYADLQDTSKDFYQGALKNLWQRGLGKSSAFVAGAKVDQASFAEKGGRDIESMGQQMQLDSIAKMAAAVGRPDQGYANIGGAYNQYAGMQNQMAQQNWMNNYMLSELQMRYSDPQRSAGVG